MELGTQTWVMTGAAGQVATSMRRGLAARVAALRLVDIRPVQCEHPGEESLVADLRDQAALERAVAGAHGVLHLGGIADEADFHDLAEVNIVGTFHALEAARRTAARRFVFASSNRTTGCYPTDTTVDTSMPARPDGLYGVSKVAGEALGRLYADKFGMSVASVRIGSFEQAPQDSRQLSTWLSPSDCLAAFLAAMTAPDLSYAAFYAVSGNTRRWWDLTTGAALGFRPSDDAEDHAAELPAQQRRALAGLQGGMYATAEYTLDRQRPAQAT